MQRRRKLIWARSFLTLAMTPAADAEWTDLLGSFRTIMGITANLPGTTVSRVRIDFAAANVANFFPTYVGLQRVKISDIIDYVATPPQALAAAPQRNPDADWMAFRALYPNHGSDPVSGLPNAQSYEIDVKAMRKLDEAGQTLGLVVSKEVTTTGWSALLTTSVLLALP